MRRQNFTISHCLRANRRWIRILMQNKTRNHSRSSTVFFTTIKLRWLLLSWPTIGGLPLFCVAISGLYRRRMLRNSKTVLEAKTCWNLDRPSITPHELVIPRQQKSWHLHYSCVTYTLHQYSECTIIINPSTCRVFCHKKYIIYIQKGQFNICFKFADAKHKPAFHSKYQAQEVHSEICHCCILVRP